MAEGLASLFELAKQVNRQPVLEDPEVEQARKELLGKISDAMHRIIPSRILELSETHRWAEDFDQALETYNRWGIFSDNADKGELISPNELRNHTPSIAHLMEALMKDDGAILRKVQEGFVRVQVVPFGLSPAALERPMDAAIRHYHDQGKLRAMNGESLEICSVGTVRLRSCFNEGDYGKMIYAPRCYDSAQHGGKTKKELLESSPHPGWQVFLVQDFKVGRRIMRRETLRQELNHLGRPEQGLSPEAWQSEFLTHITQTEGEVIDSVGPPCACLGGFLPERYKIPFVYWRGSPPQVWFDAIHPDYEYSHEYSSEGAFSIPSAVQVL
ncbi:MAG: hypothetical protein PHH13_04125 [Candidatus Peribacteraceae bacterium]|nr:hypothetical protein [Candidatus Peribacteraceae bacterium]